MLALIWKKNRFMLLFVCFCSGIYARDPGNGFSVNAGFQPQLEFGSHVNSAALSASICALKTFGSFETGIYGEGISGYDFTCLAIEGNELKTSVNFGPVFGFGRSTKGLSPWNDASTKRRHEIKLVYIGYIDNRETSQFSGRLEYFFRTDRFSIGFVFEDDFFALRNRDEYRTAAFEIGSWFNNRLAPMFIFTGTKMWTGSAKGELSEGEKYDLSGVRYGKCSAGVVYLGIGFDKVRFSIGWDSESIRDMIQNNFHDIINDGEIPRISSRNDKMFINLSYGRGSSLY